MNTPDGKRMTMMKTGRKNEILARDNDKNIEVEEEASQDIAEQHQQPFKPDTQRQHGSKLTDKQLSSSSSSSSSRSRSRSSDKSRKRHGNPQKKSVDKYVQVDEQSQQKQQQQQQQQQVFAQPVFDAIAKYILSEDEPFRNYILGSLAGMEIKKSKILDDHLNPFDEYKNLRGLLNGKVVRKDFEAILADQQSYGKLTGLTEVASYYGDLLKMLPKAKHNSQVDILCTTELGKLTIEFQLVDQEYWDDRALAYTASIYAAQVRVGHDWDKCSLPKVIGINILGKGDKAFWPRKDLFVRHYKFRDEYSTLQINRIQLIQYSLGNLDLNHKLLEKNKPLRDTLEFFRDAHRMKSIPEGIDENLKKGYELVNVEYLKQKNPEILEKSENQFASYTKHNKSLIEEGELNKAKEIALSLKNEGMSREQIAKVTKLPKEVLDEVCK